MPHSVWVCVCALVIECVYMFVCVFPCMFYSFIMPFCSLHKLIHTQVVCVRVIQRSVSVFMCEIKRCVISLRVCVLQRCVCLS